MWALHQNHVHELKEQRESAREAHQTLEKENADLKQTIAQLNALTKGLTDSLSESERRNQILSDDVANVTASRHALERKVNSLEGQFEQTRQAMHAQTTAQILAVEARLTQAHNTERARLLAENQTILGLISDELGSLYGLRDLELDSQSCRAFIQKVKTDLSKRCNSV
jgi:chromosome segregation ATPase